jgi:PAS domain S-box-containing protein
VAVFVLTQYLAFLNYRINKDEEYRKVSYELSSVKQRLQRTLTHGLSATRTLAFVVENYGVPKDFDSLARDLMAAYPHIDALQLTPGGIITYIYPREGNEAAIGLNLFQDSTRSKEAYKAIQNKSLFFAGPLELKQGGIAVVGRQPVFKNNEFWGFASVVIHLQTLIRASGIDLAPTGEFTYQLSKIDPLLKREQFFLPEPERTQPGETISVEVPDGEWRLHVRLNSSAGIYSNVLLLSGIGLVLSAMSGLFGWQLARQPAKLKQMVKERTSQLTSVESKYRETLERVSDAVMSIDREWRCTFINGRASELLELFPDQCLGKLVWEDFPGLKTEPLYGACHNAISDQKYISIESFLAKQQRWFKIDIYPSQNGLSLFFDDVTEWRYAVEILKASEKYFRALIEKSSDAIVLMNKRGHVVYQSPSTERISGYTMSEIQALDGLELIHPDHQSESQKLFLSVIEAPGVSIQVSHRLRHKRGHYLWIKGTYTNLLHDENVKAIVLNYQDDTSRVLAEGKVITANRLYKIISKVNQTIVHVTDQDRLFREICAIAVDVGKFRMAWIGMIDETRERVIKSMHAGHEAGYLDKLEEISLRDTSKDQSPVTRALRTGNVVICNDVETDLSMTRWKERALERDYHSTISLPFKKFGQTVGVLCLYATTKDFFDEAEVALLTETVADLSFSLENYERENKIRLAEENALAAYKEKETVLNRINDSVISLDSDWRYTFMNDASLKTHPQGREGCIGKKLWEIHPDYLGTPFEEKYREAMRTQQQTEIPFTLHLIPGLQSRYTHLLMALPLFIRMYPNEKSMNTNSFAQNRCSRPSWKIRVTGFGPSIRTTS